MWHIKFPDPCHPYNDRRIEETDRLLGIGRSRSDEDVRRENTEYQERTGKCAYCYGRGYFGPVKDKANNCPCCKGTGEATYWPEK